MQIVAPQSDSQRRPDSGRAMGSAPNETASSSSAQLPKLTLPKGGGTLRGLDEQFKANPATGTASFSVPLPLSPGRGGFGPSLVLGYDSGAGNGPFGLGWSLDLSGVARRTDQRLPRYQD